MGRSFDALHQAADAQRAALQSVATAFYDSENGGRSFASSTEALMRQFVDEMVRVSRDSVRIIDQLAEFDGLRMELLTPRESQESLGQRRAALGALLSGFEEAL